MGRVISAMASDSGGGSAGLPVLDIIEVSDKTRAGYSLAMICDHAPHRPADKVGALDTKRIKQPNSVRCHVVKRVGHMRTLPSRQGLSQNGRNQAPRIRSDG